MDNAFGSWHGPSPCRVSCIRNTAAPDEPEKDTAATKLFASVVKQVVLTVSDTLCDLRTAAVCHHVRMLDRLVRTKAVSRDAAARMASALYFVQSHQLSYMSLHGVLRSVRRASGLLAACLAGSSVNCSSVRRVLSWGTCPHVSFLLCDRLVPAVVHATFTPTVLCTQVRHGPRLALLLGYGSPPGVRMWGGVSEPWAKWRRWHGRRGKRLWCVTSVGLP